MKRIKSILLFALMATLLLQPISASAMRTPIFLGHVKPEDSKIGMEDVVLVQKYIAKLVTLSKKQACAADVNRDGNVTMEDVTEIQKYIANIIFDFDGKDYVDPYIYFKSIYADYLSGRAMVGKPVTFTIIANSGFEPILYQFSVDGKAVSEQSEDNTFTYTFDKPGTYMIDVDMINSLDYTDKYTIFYTVAESYESEKPTVKTLYFSKGDLDRHIDIYDLEYGCTVTATAFMGKGPYLYRFLVDDKYISDDFTTKNQFLLDKDLSIGDHTITVQIKDGEGSEEFVSETFDFQVTEPKLA